MCGIIYANNLKGQPARDMIITQYEAQKSRGTNGFGYIATSKPATVSHSTTEAGILKSLKKEKSNEILFHHRTPTSTENVLKSCHPFKIKGKSGKTYYIAHNGVIHNDDDLKETHNASGLNYSSEEASGKFNDSEALAHDIMLYLEGKQKKLEAIGSIAFVAIEYSKAGNATKVHYFHNCTASPLKAKFNKESSIRISSEGPGISIPIDILYTYSHRTKKVTQKDLKTPMYNSLTNNYGTLSEQRSFFPKYYSKALYSSDYKDDSSYDEGFNDGYDNYEVCYSYANIAHAYHDITGLEFDKSFILEEVTLETDDIEVIEDQINFYQGLISGIRQAIKDKEIEELYEIKKHNNQSIQTWKGNYGNIRY